MTDRFFVNPAAIVTVSLLLALFSLSFAQDIPKGEEPYYHLAIISDPHIPGRGLPDKKAAIKTIGSWDRLDAVAVLGDVCAAAGTHAEYEYAKKFFSEIKKPICFIAGNHDYYYDDTHDNNGDLTRASAEIQEKKLKLFQKTFNQPELFFSKKIKNYNLIFLSTDELGSGDLARISQRQIDWLRAQLMANKSMPTIVFCHAPLKGTLAKYRHFIDTPDFIIQPENTIRDLILENPQIFMWVSGHTHTCPDNDNFASNINLYENQVWNIHNCPLNHRGIVSTNSLYLYPEKVVVKTFNHKSRTWMEHLQRTIATPALQARNTE